ncbi:hypothetical protein SAMN04488028_103244 [Reichenbachiella agariperforans]|uniref:DUF4249 domain-containing protein n=1 Tax=Reichenbachiella agariperforans TaxID=156994 RepID=A0A1M6QAR8_REIAG|nr:hypothetical protein [Reichenbachiella agariperforans]SHK17230.1 hypothetical protein SAMN04488028_103244 [Reichenbachiella agariperforans]
MGRLILLFLVVIAVAGCEKEAIVDSRERSVLQVEATFFSGETLPVVTIGQSVNLPGERITVLDSATFFIDDADIVFTWNGDTVDTRAVGKGQYQGVSDDTVQVGDVFTISVRDGDRSARATAMVPDIDVGEIKVSFEDTVLVEEYMIWLERQIIVDTLEDGTYQYERADSSVWLGEAKGQAIIPLVEAYLYFDVASTDISFLDYRYQDSPDVVSDYYSNTSYDKIYLGENYVGFSEIRTQVSCVVVIKTNEELSMEQKKLTAVQRMIIPEPIYLDFYHLTSLDFVPITVTNVNGGVGLFIGAVKSEVTYDFQIPIKKG